MAIGTPTGITQGPDVWDAPPPPPLSPLVAGLACCPTAVGAQMSFTLSADASVTCEVLNIAGRPVRMVVTDRQMVQGMNTLAWDGHNATGARVPAGLYLVRVTTAAEDGGRSQAISTVQIRR